MNQVALPVEVRVDEVARKQSLGSAIELCAELALAIHLILDTFGPRHSLRLGVKPLADRLVALATNQGSPLAIDVAD